MVKPRTSPGIRKSPGVLMAQTLLLTALIFAGLECRHPYFAMNDDNLVAGYPCLCEMGRHLLHGESPRYSDYIFGGHYDLLRDAQYFAWHPLYLLTSLLAETPFRLCMVDINAFVLFLVAAAGFLRLAIYLREEGLLDASDGWLVFCTLSYTFTMMALVTTESWLSFENNVGALPWLALGILQKQWRWGAGLVALFSIHQILGGHLEPLISNSLFLSLFAVGVSFWRRSLHPLYYWLGGYALAVILLLPLLVPVVDGFLSTVRFHGTLLSDVESNKIPGTVFGASFFLGAALSYFHAPTDGSINGIYIFTIGSCAAAWCLVPALFSKAKWRFLELLSLGLMALAVIFVCRPVFVSEIMMRLPILKSMRWPFREILQLQFFFHLFLVLRPMTCAPRVRFLTALSGSAAFVIPMLLSPVTPTFNDMRVDRAIILSNKIEPYWAKLRTFFKPGDEFVVLIPKGIDQTDSMDRAYCLMCAYGFPMMARIVCASGYSQTSPSGHIYLHTLMESPWGAYKIATRDELLRERPHLKFITLEQVRPLKITLSSGDGPTIDLTPYFPQDVEAWR